MEPLDFAFLCDLCANYILLEYENSIREKGVIVSDLSSMWYAKGRLNGYMTALKLSYSEKDGFVYIKNSSGKIIYGASKQLILEGD